AAADRAGVGLHDPVLELHPVEDPLIRGPHRAIALEQRRLVEMERVRVLHHELARAHHAEARADLVAKLRADLVVVDRELPVALVLAARDAGIDLHVRRPQAEVALAPLLAAQDLGPVRVPATTLEPQLRGLYDRHRDFERSGSVHLLADDAL